MVTELLAEDSPDSQLRHNAQATAATSFLLVQDLLQMQDELFDNNDNVARATKGRKRKFNELSVDTAMENTDQLWSVIEESNAMFSSWAHPALDEWSAKALYASGINASKLRTINQSIPRQV